MTTREGFMKVSLVPSGSGILLMLDDENGEKIEIFLSYDSAVNLIERLMNTLSALRPAKQELQ